MAVLGEQNRGIRERCSALSTRLLPLTATARMEERDASRASEGRKNNLDNNPALADQATSV